MKFDDAIESGEQPSRGDWIVWTNENIWQTDALLFIRHVQYELKRAATLEELVERANDEYFPSHLIKGGTLEAPTAEQRLTALRTVLGWRDASPEHTLAKQVAEMEAMSRAAQSSSPRPIESVVKVLPAIPHSQWDNDLESQKPRPEQASEPLSPMSPNIKW